MIQSKIVLSTDLKEYSMEEMDEMKYVNMLPAFVVLFRVLCLIMIIVSPVVTRLYHLRWNDNSYLEKPLCTTAILCKTGCCDSSDNSKGCIERFSDTAFSLQ